MKLVYVTNVINTTTGLERMITIQTNYLIENYNYEIDLVLLEQNENEEKETFKLHDKIKLHFLNVKNKGVKRIYSKIVGLNQVLEKIAADIVVICLDDILGLYLPSFFNKKRTIVYQRHSTKAINLNRSKSSLKTKFLNAIKKGIITFGGGGYDKFVLLTESSKNDWKHLKNIAVIPNPLILDSKDLMSTLGTKTVIAVGRHDPVKGFDMLLKSWAKTVGKHPNWKLKIIGKENTRINLVNCAKELGIANSVIFQKHTRDMPGVYLEASILACTSRIEGFSLVILEAMSFGVPVVSFDCPYGPRAIIKNNEDGILVPPNDINSFSDSLNLLIENSDIRKRLGNQAKINIQRFSQKNIMPLWKSLFESLL